MSDWSSISVVMITRNGASTLVKALESVPGGAEIIIADNQSTDHTVAIGQSFGATVIQQDQTLIAAAGGNFDVARNQAMAVAKRPWLFILDSDEQLTTDLAAEITEVICKKEEHVAYDMPRYNFFWNKKVRLLGDDRQIRLIQRGYGYYGGHSLHVPICIAGSIGRLERPLIHHNITSMADVIRMFHRYLPIEQQNCRQFTGYLAALRHTFHMGKYYLGHQQAWRDGWKGILVSCIYSLYHGLTLWPGKKRP